MAKMMIRIQSKIQLKTLAKTLTPKPTFLDISSAIHVGTSLVFIVLAFFFVGMFQVALASGDKAQRPKAPVKPIPPFELVALSESVTVALKPKPHRIVDSNIVIIKNQRNLVIVDANDNLNNAKKLIAEIKSRYQLPVHYVVNTHWHSDHVLANQLYQKAFPMIKDFVAHESMRESIETRSQKQLDEKIGQWEKAIIGAEAKIEQGIAAPELVGKVKKAKLQLAELKSLSILPPTLTYESKLTLPNQSQPIELLHFGKAHTEGDSIVYLPEQRLIIVGDLFDHLPYAGHGYPSEWLHTLKEIEKLDFDTVIPGHGAIQKGKDNLRLIIRLLAESIDKANQAVAKNIDKQQFMQRLDLSDYRPWFGELDDLGERVFNQFIPEFFEKAFDEAAGNKQEISEK